MRWASRILKRLGMKAKAWDHEFETEYWDKGTKGDPIYGVLAKYPGSVLEMGCGSAMTPREMEFTTYTGVDISQVAIAKAVLYKPEHRFAVSSMESYIPDRKYRVILFRESIYYAKNVSDLLERLEQYLEPDGVFIARICSSDRHQKVIREIICFWRINEIVTLNTGGIIMVFGAKRSGGAEAEKWNET